MLAVVADNLEELAGLAEGPQQAMVAARLLGAAQAIRDGNGLARWPLLQARYERAMENVRSLLGDAAFAAALEVGGALPLDDAIAAAQEADPAGRVPSPYRSVGQESNDAV
jgi:hypothetical protein